jgi:hypothetical protein
MTTNIVNLGYYIKAKPMYTTLISYTNCDVAIRSNCVNLLIYYANYIND